MDAIPDPESAVLAGLLGYGAGDRLLILTADLLGMCHSANVGVYDSLRSGAATGAHGPRTLGPRGCLLLPG